MSSSHAWDVYDALLDGLPQDGSLGRVERGVVAPVWTCVRDDRGRAGIAMTPLVEYRPIELRGRIAGMDARELAEHIRSWNYHQAALGHAAVNMWYNRAERIPWDDARVVETPGRPAKGDVTQAPQPMFADFMPIMEGKKVAIIGHTDSMLPLSDICDLTILERIPRPFDLPDPACEYVLPEQDVVFITGSAFANKTAARLIQLAANATTVLWGPSVPLCPALFDMGVDVLLGHVVVDADEVLRVACEGGLYMDFAHATRSLAWFADKGLAEKLGSYSH